MGKYKQQHFHWLKRHLPEKENAYTLFELGCFDCKSLQFLPKPSRYVGADAGVDGGLEDARVTFGKAPWVDLIMTQTAHELERYKDQHFDYTVALNTLEYIPEAVLRGYLAFLAKVTQKRLLVSVPVEIGTVFLVKHIGRNFFSSAAGGDRERYTFKEIYWATRGQVQHVQRFERKGFDYRNLVKLIGEHFNIIKVEGIPFRFFPQTSPQVGIIAEPKRKA